MEDTVVIISPGEPKLRILRSALAEHEALGWTKVGEDQAPENDPGMEAFPPVLPDPTTPMPAKRGRPRRSSL